MSASPQPSPGASPKPAPRKSRVPPPRPPAPTVRSNPATPEPVPPSTSSEDQPEDQVLHEKNMKDLKNKRVAEETRQMQTGNYPYQMFRWKKTLQRDFLIEKKGLDFCFFRRK